MAEKKVPAALATQRAETVAEVLEAMKRDGLRFAQGFAGAASPHNYATGRRYHGINRFYLSWKASRHGWNDSRWVTPRQAMEISARRGEHWAWAGEECTLVEWPLTRDVFETDDAGNAVLDPMTGRPKVKYSYITGFKYYRVLNLAQIKGAPAAEPVAKPLQGDFTRAQAIIDNYYPKTGCGFEESPAVDVPCYSPLFDRVQVPSRELFESVAGFTGTLAHETIHSTGTASRLDRDMGGMFGSESYAFEELVAELGSVMLCADLGFTYEHDERSLENHAAYLQSWMKALSGQDGFDVLQRAESLADKAATYIEGFIPKNALAIRISQRVLVEERMQDPRGIETILGLDATQPGMTAARAEMTERLITGQLLDELARDAAAALVPVLGFLAPPCGEVDEEKVLADILSGGAKEHILALMDKPIDDMDEDMVVAAAQALDLVVEAEAVRRAGVACRENASMASEYLAKVKVDALSDVERGRLDDAVRRTKESFKPVSPETFSAWLRGEDEPGRIPEHTRAQEMARTPALRGRAV